MQHLGEDLLHALKTFMENAPVCLMISGFDHEVYWSNRKMQDWSGYTSEELKQIGWRRLSADDSNLQADIAAAEDCRDGRSTSYVVRKKYCPKNDSPQWGQLGVVRFPEKGEFKCFICVWVPMHNASEEAFTLAMEYITQHTEQMTALTRTIQNLEQTSVLRRLLNSLADFMEEYPRAAAAILLFFLSSIGINGMLDVYLKLTGQSPVTQQGS